MRHLPEKLIYGYGRQTDFSVMGVKVDVANFFGHSISIDETMHSGCDHRPKIKKVITTKMYEK